MKIVTYPATILDTKLDEVDIANPKLDLKELHLKMEETMMLAHGIGLAANQVNINQSLFIMRTGETGTSMIINPQVLQHTSDSELLPEGCLSFPGVKLQVKRPKEILVEYYNENLEKCTSKLDGYTCRIFLHEFDHLVGITFKDRVSSLKWNMANKKLDKRKLRGY